jgi:hypothetical protein
MRSLFVLLQRINWPLLAALGLAACLMKPLLQTGFIADDAGNSLLHGILAYHRITMLELLRCSLNAWMPTRFIPVAFAQTYAVFYVFTDRVCYKIFIIVCLVCNLILFYRFVLKLTRSEALSTLTIVIIMSAFQMRNFHDPILAFNGLLQTLLMFLLISYLALIAYLDSGKTRWLILSILTYVLACFTYEISHLLLAVHMAIIVHRRGISRRAFTLAGLYLCFLALCVAVPILLRIASGQDSLSAYHPNFEPRAFLTTLAKQLLAAAPLSYSFAKPEGHSMFQYLQMRDRSFLRILAVCALVCLSILDGLRRFINRGGKLNYPILLSLGVLLWALPAIPIALTPRYQKEVFWGVGYLPVYIQYSGMGCLITSGVAYVLERLRDSFRFSAIFMTVIALLVAATLTITYRSNSAAVRGFSPVLLNERLNIEGALHEGLLADVPDESILVLRNDYDWWHGHYSRYFYMTHAGKRFITLTLKQDGGQSRWEPTVGLSNPNTIPSEASCYEITDSCAAAGHGFVFLSELEEGPAHIRERQTSHGAKRIRLFVQGGVCREGHRWFYVTGRRLVSDDRLFFMPSQDLKVVAEAAEGTIFEIPQVECPVDADSLEGHWSHSPIDSLAHEAKVENVSRHD